MMVHFYNYPLSASISAIVHVRIESPPYDDFGYYNITIDLIGENGCVTTIADDMFIGNNPTIRLNLTQVIQMVFAPPMT